MVSLRVDMVATPAVHSTLKTISGRIAELQSLKNDLLRQLASVDASLTEEHARFAHVNNSNVAIATLPPEILSTIFEAGDRMDRDRRRRHFRTLVCSVSRHWRTIALGFSALWSEIEIDACKRSIDFNTLSEIISRSGAAGLRVTVHFDGLSTASAAEEIMALFDPDLHRLESLSLYNMQSEVLYAVIECTHYARAPRLRALTLHGQMEGPLSLATMGPLFLGGAPSLQHLSLHGTSPRLVFPHGPSIISPQLHNDYPEGLSLHFSSLRGFLQSLPCLETLVIADDFVMGWPDRTDAYTTYKPVTLPRLRSLDISYSVFDNSSNLLACICAPLLHTVQLAFPQHLGPGLCRVFSGTHAGTERFPAVRHLLLRRCMFPPGQAKLIMTDIFPHLTHLEFAGPLERYTDPEQAKKLMLSFLLDRAGAPLGVDLQDITFGYLDNLMLDKLCQVMRVRGQRGLGLPTVAIPEAVVVLSGVSLDTKALGAVTVVHIAGKPQQGLEMIDVE